MRSEVLEVIQLCSLEMEYEQLPASLSLSIRES